MKYSEIQKKKDKELHKMLVEKKEDLRKASFEAAGSAGKSMKSTKKDIARILTELTARGGEVAEETTETK